MKTNLKHIVAMSACAALILTGESVNADPSGFYVRGDAGGTWVRNTDLKDYFGTGTAGTKVKFDPGARVGLIAGYQLTDWISAEAETGVMVNSFKIDNADRVDAFYSNVPLLLNARLQWPSKCRFTPYIGGGAGASVSSLEIDKIDLNGTSVEGSDSDAVFVWQGFAGICYALNGSMSVGLEYHYFAADAPAWSAENISGRIRFGRTETHAVSAAFEFRF